MKGLMKVLLALLAIAGVGYWLLGKVLAPAQKAHRRLHRKDPSDGEKAAEDMGEDE